MKVCAKALKPLREAQTVHKLLEWSGSTFSWIHPLEKNTFAITVVLLPSAHSSVCYPDKLFLDLFIILSKPSPTYLEDSKIADNDVMLHIWSEQLESSRHSEWRENGYQDTDGPRLFFPLCFTVFFFLLFVSAWRGMGTTITGFSLTLIPAFILGREQNASFVTFLCSFWSGLSSFILPCQHLLTCWMWCCCITGSLNVRSCRDKRRRQQKVNGAAARGWGWHQWRKCMLGRINGSSNNRMPTAETGQECSHHSNTLLPGNEVVQLLQMSVRGWTWLLWVEVLMDAKLGWWHETKLSPLPTFVLKRSTKWQFQATTIECQISTNGQFVLFLSIWCNVLGSKSYLIVGITLGCGNIVKLVKLHSSRSHL